MMFGTVGFKRCSNAHLLPVWSSAETGNSSKTVEKWHKSLTAPEIIECFHPFPLTLYPRLGPVGIPHVVLSRSRMALEQELQLDW